MQRRNHKIGVVGGTQTLAVGGPGFDGLGPYFGWLMAANIRQWVNTLGAAKRSNLTSQVVATP
jgi:hypothetical protein